MNGHVVTLFFSDSVSSDVEDEDTKWATIAPASEILARLYLDCIAKSISESPLHPRCTIPALTLRGDTKGFHFLLLEPYSGTPQSPGRHSFYHDSARICIFGGDD